MNYFHLPFALTAVIYLTGCKEQSVEKTANAHKFPTLEFIKNDWVYDGAIVKGYRNLAKAIDSHPVFHVIAPSEMKCSELRKLWRKMESSKVELRLSITSSTKSAPQPSLYIVKDNLGQPIEIEPMLVSLRENGLSINRVQVTAREFQETAKNFATLAHANNMIPKSNIFFEDSISYEKLIKCLTNHQEITFEITLIEGCKEPKADHTIKRKPASPKSSYQDLLHRENGDYLEDPSFK